MISRYHNNIYLASFLAIQILHKGEIRIIPILADDGYRMYIQVSIHHGHHNRIKLTARYETFSMEKEGPLLLTWFNFNPSMDKQLDPS